MNWMKIFKLFSFYAYSNRQYSQRYCCRFNSQVNYFVYMFSHIHKIKYLFICVTINSPCISGSLGLNWPFTMGRWGWDRIQLRRSAMSSFLRLGLRSYSSSAVTGRVLISNTAWFSVTTSPMSTYLSISCWFFTSQYLIIRVVSSGTCVF